MNHKKRFLYSAIVALVCCGCIAVPSTTPPAPSSWDQSLNATARVVLNATFFAPTETPTPSPTATITPTPVPTRAAPTLTPTVSLAVCIHPGSQSQTGRVTAVLDGETILVEIDGQEYKVRYIGISAPKDAYNRQVFGEKATAINRELVEGQTIQLVKDTTDTDRSGRLLRYIYAGDIFVNLELVRLGLATAISNPPDTACYDTFHQAEHEASVKRAGMWSRPAPTKTPLGYGLERMTDVPCNCYGEDLDCSDFEIQIQAQACLNYCRSLNLHDLFNLDADGNTIACE